MAQIISPSEFYIPLKIYIRNIQLTEEQFFLLCQEDDDNGFPQEETSFRPRLSFFEKQAVIQRAIADRGPPIVSG